MKQSFMMSLCLASFFTALFTHLVYSFFSNYSEFLLSIWTLLCSFFFLPLYFNYAVGSWGYISISHYEHQVQLPLDHYDHNKNGTRLSKCFPNFSRSLSQWSGRLLEQPTSYDYLTSSFFLKMIMYSLLWRQLLRWWKPLLTLSRECLTLSRECFYWGQPYTNDSLAVLIVKEKMMNRKIFLITVCISFVNPFTIVFELLYPDCPSVHKKQNDRICT